jgi:hypothetical protein
VRRVEAGVETGEKVVGGHGGPPRGVSLVFRVEGTLVMNAIASRVVGRGLRSGVRVWCLRMSGSGFGFGLDEGEGRGGGRSDGKD